MRSSGKELGCSGGQIIHLSDSYQNFIHHQSIAHKQVTFEEALDEIKETVKGIKDESKHTAKVTTDLTGKVIDLQKQLESQTDKQAPDQNNVDNSVAARMKHLELQDAQNQAVIKALRKEAHDLKGEIQALRREFQQLQRTGYPSSRHTGATGRETQG